MVLGGVAEGKASLDPTEVSSGGGVAFLQRGKMFCGLATEDLMVRIGPEHATYNTLKNQLLQAPDYMMVEFAEREGAYAAVTRRTLDGAHPGRGLGRSGT